MALLAGCAGVGALAPTGEGFRSAEARQAPQSGLQKYYDQVLTWKGCGSGNQCATLLVPLDYANPNGVEVRIAVLKNPATGDSPRGPLVVNPGGPGGSGVDYAAAADRVVTPQLHDAFDIVGFDPRGVGKSQPLNCLTGSQIDEFLATDATPDDQQEADTLVTESKEFGADCLAASAEMTAHIGSTNVVKDMDILRSALNQQTLDYLGFSYGTLLGAMYADEFTDRVGRFVLDGAMDPSLSNTEIAKGQALGFEVAIQRYIDHCIAEGKCPLGNDPVQAKQKLQAFLDSLDANPLPTGDANRPLTQALAMNAVIYPLYQPDYGWPLLTTALTLGLAGDGSAMLHIVDTFNERNADGTYEGNGTDALYAVNCVDRPDRPDLAQTEQLAQQWSTEAPMFGGYLAYGNLPCAYWPVPATGAGHATLAKGSPAILVVGTQYDPATPYVWAKALASQLENGVLVSWMGGDGHTAYNNGSDCIDRTIDAYLIHGVVPPKGKECS